MSDLRDRIAAAITGIRIQRDGDAYQMADAVIEELGLREEWGALDPTHSGLTADTREQATKHPLHPTETLMLRYTTQWKPQP